MYKQKQKEENKRKKAHAGYRLGQKLILLQK
jgi:hypothetical protein